MTVYYQYNRSHFESPQFTLRIAELRTGILDRDYKGIHHIKKMEILKKLRGGLLRGKTLKQVLLIVTIPMAVLSIGLLGTFSSLISSRMVEKETIDHTKDLQSQIILSLHYFIEQLYNVMDTPQYDPSFIMYCRDTLSRDVDDAKNDAALFRYLHQIYSSNPYIENTLFIMPNGKIFTFGMNIFDTDTTLEEISNEEWYRKTIEAHGTIIWHETGPFTSFNTNLIMCSREIWDTLNSETLGVLVIAINPEMLHDQYKDVNLIKNNILMIINDNGSIISSSDYLMRTRNIQDMPVFSPVLLEHRNQRTEKWRDERKIIIWNSIDLTNWKIVSVLSRRRVMTSARDIARFTVIIAVISIAIFVAFAWRFSSNVTEPLDSLIDKMQAVPQGNFESVLHAESYREINMLSSTFNAMTQDMARLLQEVYETQNEKHETELKLLQSELKALQAQINPHFIYNTLESINTIAKMKNEWDISNVIIALSKMLRISLSKGYHIIPIGQELEMVTQYAAIQNINYPNRFTLINTVDPSLYDYAIVKFTFQPLVENTIFHGFSTVEYQGEIILSAQLDNGKIIFELTDNGIGMDEKHIHVINKKLSSTQFDIPGSNNTTDGFGIHNVNSRIKLHFGEKYGLQYSSNERGGSTVIIQIPSQKIHSKNGIVV